MIEEKSSVIQFSHDLSNSWMTDSQMDPMMFVSAKTDKLLPSDALQLQQRVREPLTAVGIYNPEQLSHVQSPLLHHGMGNLQTHQVVPNLDEKGVTFGNTNISPGLCLSDSYGYETVTSDDWTLEEEEGFTNFADCLNPDWEYSLIRQSIEDQELEIYLPRNLSPTPLDHLYSTIPRSSNKIKCSLDGYGRQYSTETRNQEQLITNKGETMHQFSAESDRSREPASKCFPNRKVGTYITRSYSESSIGYCNTQDSNTRIAYDCVALHSSPAHQVARGNNDDNKSASVHAQMKRSSNHGVQNVPIMSTRVIPTKARSQDARPQAFSYTDNAPFSPNPIYSGMERTSEYDIFSKCQYPMDANEHNNNNATSPITPHLKDYNFCSPVSDKSHFKSFSFNSSSDDHYKTLLTLEKPTYVLPTAFRSQISEDRSAMDSDHSSGSGVTHENGSARLTHNDIERQRRNQMKVKFDHLKSCLPDISKCERSPKILVLNRARDYIRWLQKEDRALEQDKEKVKTTNRLLLQRLVHLTGQVKDMAGP